MVLKRKDQWVGARDKGMLRDNSDHILCTGKGPRTNSTQTYVMSHTLPASAVQYCGGELHVRSNHIHVHTYKYNQ